MMNSNQGAKHRYLFVVGAVTMSILGSTVSIYAQKPTVATTSLTIPAAPTISPDSAFLSQAAGRAAIADAAYALSSAPRLSVSAKWRVLTQDERSRVTGRTGTEALIRDASANRLSIVSVTDQAGNAPALNLRFVSDGTVLVGTRYAPLAPNAKPQPGATPERTYFRIPISGDVETATDALILAKANAAPLTRVARTVLLSPLENGGYGWRGRGMFYQSGDGSVLEALPVDANDRRTVTTIRRYRIDAKTRRPTAVEEWVTVANTDRKTTRTTYREERYTYTAYPTRTDIYSTKTVPNYVETSPPSGANLPDVPGPDDADSQARALLQRWQRAWARLSSYNTRISVTAEALAQTPESHPIPPQDASQEGGYTLYYRRPGRLYVVAEPYTQPSKDRRGMTRRPTTITAAQTAISDGTTLSVYDGANKTNKRGDAPINGEDAALRQGLRRNGMPDGAEALTWILDGPQSLFGTAEFAEYRGSLPLPGVSGAVADAVTLRQTFSQNGVRRRQRGIGRGGGGSVQTTVYTTVYFNKATGLPLRIERYISTNNEIVGRRDSPPNRFVSADYENARVNEETSAGIFKR